jgi:hypothetical protein
VTLVRLLRCAALGMPLLLLVSACFGRSPRPEFFTLSALAAGAPSGPLATRPDLGLAIGPLALPRYLDRPELVSRDGDQRLVLGPSQRWAGSLRTDVLRVLGDDLGTLLGTKSVVAYPLEPTFPIDYRVLIDLRRFDGTLGEAVTLRARWTVLSGLDGVALAVEETQLEEAVASDGWEDYVAAQNRALSSLSREIAARILALSRR